MTPELWQRLKPLYDAALELAPSMRDQYVEQVCGNDHELKRELIALLKAGTESTWAGEAPLLSVSNFLIPDVRPFSIGERILGRFEIVRHLGTGGMGEVYEATDLELGRIALKTIRPEIAGNPNTLARFRKEVQLARKVTGPNICRIHELFVIPSSGKEPQRVFLTMEFLDGTTLADKIVSDGSLPGKEAQQITLQICAGLQTIHEAGIIHRDLKSRNIMLASRNGSTCAILMDFGLARDFSHSATETHTDITKTEAIVGTPDYMAPEQFEGKELGPATDLYALGVVLYEMLTGKRPFSADTPIAAAVQRGRALAPVSSTQSHLSRQWDSIIAKCLEFRVEKRYQTALDLRRDLERLQSTGVKRLYLYASSGLGKIRRDSPRKFWMSISVASVLLAGVILAVWYFYPCPEPFASLAIEQISDSGDITDVAISPDGKTLAEIRSEVGEHAIWIRNISTNKDVEISQPTQLAYRSLIFSRDSNKLYFVRQDGDNLAIFNLYELPVFGGEPRPLASNASGPISLSSDGLSLAYVRYSGGSSELHTTKLDDAVDKTIIDLTGEVASLAWSPDGTSLALSLELPAMSKNLPRPTITLLNVRSLKRRELLLPEDIDNGPTDLTWLPSGKQLLLLFGRRYSGVADPGTQIGQMQMDSGGFRRLTDGTVSHSVLALSADGKLLVTLLQQSNFEIGFYDTSRHTLSSSTGGPRMASSIAWLNDDELLTSAPWLGIVRRESSEFRDLDLIMPRETQETGFSDNRLWNTAPTVCHDGRIIIIGALDWIGQLFMVDSHGRFIKTLIKTAGAGDTFCSQKNESVYYAILDSPDPAIWSLSLAGGTPHKLMPISHIAPIAYSADGELAVYLASDAGDSARIVNLDQHEVVRDLPLTNHAQGTLLRFSPDKKSVIYVEQQKQGYALVLQPLDGSAPHRLTDWFRNPVTDFNWSPSGKTLAILWEHSTSDVALITDKSGKPSD